MNQRLLHIIVFLLSTSIIFSQSEISRVEPPNWWVGMEYNEIELLIYGKDISHLTPKINYEGVSIVSRKSYENENYLFVTLKIDADTKSGNIKIIFAESGKEILSNNYELQGRLAGRRNIKGFDGSDAMYLITPDRFANGDSSNDNIAGMREIADRSVWKGRHGGDIKGIVDNLDYIKDMGFTSIWLNPLLENDMEVYSYHGYSTTDYYKVDARFGTNEDYKDLCDIAASKGMKIIMDMIVNHCGSFHWWMNDLPTADWINQWPEYTGTNHKKTIILDPYAVEADKKIFTDGWFVSTMPDLNQRNASMAKYLIQNTLWWIEYSGIAGIRMDTYPYPDMHFMTKWTEVVMKEYPDFNIVGEEWNLEPTIVSYWQAGKENQNGYTSELKSVMDFPLQNALVKSLNEESKWNSSWNHVYEMLGQDYLYPDPMNLVIFPDNHDMSRIHAQLGKDIAKTKLAVAYFATTRGIPQFYYGTEILMADETGDHGEIRSDLVGGWSGDKKSAMTGEGLSSEQKEFKAYLSRVLNWRKESNVIHNGQTIHYVPEKNDVYVYFRYNATELVMVVLNKSGNEVYLDLGRFTNQLQGHSFGNEVITGKEIILNKTLKIPSKTAVIIEVK